MTVWMKQMTMGQGVIDRPSHWIPIEVIRRRIFNEISLLLSSLVEYCFPFKLTNLRVAGSKLLMVQWFTIVISRQTTKFFRVSVTPRLLRNTTLGKHVSIPDPLSGLWLHWTNHYLKYIENGSSIWIQNVQVSMQNVNSILRFNQHAHRLYWQSQSGGFDS